MPFKTIIFACTHRSFHSTEITSSPKLFNNNEKCETYAKEDQSTAPAKQMRLETEMERVKSELAAAKKEVAASAQRLKDTRVLLGRVWGMSSTIEVILELRAKRTY